jgi:putative membrane protein
MRKAFLPSLIVACALAMPAMADDGTAGQRAPTAAGPRDATGPQADASNQPASDVLVTDNDRILANRDDSQTKAMMRGDSEQKVDAILDGIKASPEKAGEKLFLLEAAMGNQWEIELSRLAQQKSQDPQVKELAQMMVSEHTAAQQKLTTLANQWGMDLPTSLPAGKQRKLDAIGSLPAEKFDSCYVLMLKADHASAITSYADHQVALEDQSVKSYIGEVLPKLKMHGQHVVDVARAKDFGADDIALGGVSSEAGIMGNPDQRTDREVNSNSTSGSDTSNNTNRKPTDTNPPR